MQIIDGKALLLKLRNPSQVTTVIPKSKKVSEHEVLVNWGVEESLILKSMNINVPAPITGRYDWPGQYRPMKHQRSTASFLTMHQKAFCFNEQGTGKTASAIWAADFLMKRKAITRAVIVCPLSIMDSAWKSDIFSVAMHRHVGIAYGSAEKRRKVIALKPDFLIINYDGLEIVADDIAKAGYDLFIVDEATHYKNAQSVRWKVLNKLVGPDTWLWLMTGTPAAQGPEDAFGLAKLVNPTSVPRYVAAFRDMVMVKTSRFKWEPKPGAVDTVHRVLQPAIRYTKDECLDLPDMVYTKREVELTTQQLKYYKKMKTQMLMDVQGDQVTAVNAAVVMSKLLQIACGAIYTDEGDTLEFDIQNRYRVLKEVIDESSQKVLVFVPFKHTISLLAEKLRADGITAEVISGEVPPGQRTDIFGRFQTKTDPRVLIIQPQSAAHGVTLTAANTVVWWGPTSSLETYAQANARVHRAGQKHHCTVVQLCGAPIERHVYALLDKKLDVHSKVVDLYNKLLE